MKSLVINIFMKIKARNVFSKNVISLENSIRVQKEAIELLQKTDIKDFDSLYNLSLYSALGNLDLLILLKNVLRAKRKYEKALFARLLALTIIEYMDDINPLIGHDLLNELNNNNLSEFTINFKSINKRYSTIKKNNERLLRQIRNTTAAHKSTDSLKLINYIEQLNIPQIISLGIEIIKIMNDLTNETIKLITKINSILKAKL